MKAYCNLSTFSWVPPYGKFTHENEFIVPELLERVEQALTPAEHIGLSRLLPEIGDKKFRSSHYKIFST